MSTTYPTADHLALRRLRKHHGLTQHECADRLGLKLPTYQAYEYGHTKQVPRRVMERARELELDPSYQFCRARFHGRPMSEIVEDWARRAGVEPRASALAAVLGIAKSTVSRWLSNDASRPTVARIVMYERRIEEEEKWLASRRRARDARRVA